MTYHKHFDGYQTQRHWVWSNLAIILLGFKGIGVCIKRGKQWRNRWVFVSRSGVSFIGW